MTWLGMAAGRPNRARWAEGAKDPRHIPHACNILRLGLHCRVLFKAAHKLRHLEVYSGVNHRLLHELGRLRHGWASHVTSRASLMCMQTLRQARCFALLMFVSGHGLQGRRVQSAPFALQNSPQTDVRADRQIDLSTGRMMRTPEKSCSHILLCSISGERSMHRTPRRISVPYGFLDSKGLSKFSHGCILHPCILSAFGLQENLL